MKIKTFIISAITLFISLYLIIGYHSLKHIDKNRIDVSKYITLVDEVSENKVQVNWKYVVSIIAVENKNKIKNISDDKIIEMAISLDKGYSKDELADIAFDMRNINTKWIWLDTFSQAQMNEFKEEVKSNNPKSCGIIESQVRCINYNYNNGNIYSGITDINGIYNSWLEYLRDGNENNITSEINKKLYEQLIKDGKDNASNVKILGFIVEGTKEELNELINKPYIKASTLGVAIDSLY